MVKYGKNHQEAVKQLDKTKAYHPREAIELAKKVAHARFDETVELHLRMGVDPRNANQQVRGVALLPHGLGKEVRVLVFAQGEGERVAETAGADFAGGDELVKKIENGWLDFDTPAFLLLTEWYYQYGIPVQPFVLDSWSYQKLIDIETRLAGTDYPDIFQLDNQPS